MCAKRLMAASLVTVSLSTLPLQAAPLTPGNVLVAKLFYGSVSEYTPAGTLVQTFLLPELDPPFEYARDIVVDSNGNIQAYNGTFTTELESIDPVSGAITGQTFDGWSTVNNISYGGIAVIGDSVFVTDMATYGAEAQGIVRFSTSGGAPHRFADSEEYTDLTIGGDGLLYALRGNGDHVDVFDPATEAPIRTINLDITLVIADVRGIAVDAAGMIYAAAWNGSVYVGDADGNTLDSRSTGFSNLTDIDVDDAGNLLVGSRFGGVIFTDVNLSSLTSFTVSGEPTTHVAFTTPLTLPASSIDVQIDVKPGSDTNPVNVKNRNKNRGKSPSAGGSLPVAVLTTADFDAADVDPSKFWLGDPALPGAVPPTNSSVTDVDGDGDDDLLLQFSIRELIDLQAIDADSVMLELHGETQSGQAIVGDDLVTVKP